MTMLLEPFEPLARLQRELLDVGDSFPSPFDGGPVFASSVQTYPPINAWEEKDDAFVEAELPGLSIEDVKVLISGNELTLSGERKACQGECKTGSCLRRERSEGTFSRIVTLPWEIDATKVSAKLVDGVLTVRLPKSEQSKPRKISIAGA